MKGFVQALKLVGAYFLMYAVFVGLSALLVSTTPDFVTHKIRIL